MMKLVALALLAAQGLGASLSPRSATIRTPDGESIHYLEAGRGPAILFVPGWTMPAEIFAPQLAHFGLRWRVVSMDLRGQGRSSKPSDNLDPLSRGRDIKALVDQLKLAPVMLVGWSNGVADVAAYVEQFGTMGIAGFVFVDGTAGSALDPGLAAGAMKFFSGFIKDRRSATEAFVRSMYRKPQSEAYLKEITEASLQTPTDTAVALGISTVASDFRDALAKIDKPAMLVVTESPFIKYYEDMRTRIKGVRYEVFAEVGHALFVDDAARFNALVEEFARTSRAAQPPDR